MCWSSSLNLNLTTGRHTRTRGERFNFNSFPLLQHLFIQFTHLANYLSIQPFSLPLSLLFSLSNTNKGIAHRETDRKTVKKAANKKTKKAVEPSQRASCRGRDGRDAGGKSLWPG